MKYLIFMLFLFIINVSFSNDFSDIEIGDFVNIKENSIVYILDKTNCFVCTESIKLLMIDAEKLNLKQYLVLSGESIENTLDFIKQNKFPFIALDDKDFKYSNEFKIKSTPALFVINFLGEVQFISQIGKGEISADNLTPNRVRIPTLNSAFDYFYSQRNGNNIYTYNASKNSIVKISDLKNIKNTYTINDGSSVVKTMKFKNDTLIVLQYSPIQDSKLIFLDSNLVLLKTIPIFSNDLGYREFYSIGQDFLFLDNKILSSCRYYYDSIKTNIKLLEIDVTSGELKKFFTWADSTNDNAIFLKNSDSVAFFNNNDANYFYIFPQYKIYVKDLLKLNTIKNYHGITNSFTYNDNFYLFIGFLADGYGSQVSRVNYLLRIYDDKLQLISEHNLYKSYMNSYFIFFDFINKDSIEILGKDNFGIFLEKIRLLK